MLTIRPIRPEEVTPARRLILGIAYRMFGWEGSLEDSLRYFESSGHFQDMQDVQASYFGRGGLFLVALEQERLVGTGAIRPLEGATAELKRLWLLEEFQGRGIGYDLVTRLLDFARAQGFQRVRLFTDRRQGRAIGFYRRVGFHEIPMQPTPEDDMAMEIAL